MNGSMTGRNIWIVGAGSGVGEACALRFASQGANLILTGRRADALERVAARTGHATETLLATGDMSKEQDVATVVEAIRTRFGRLDAVINCAGVNIVARELGELSPGSLAKVLDGNLTAACLVSLAVLPLMREQGAGVIVHFASWAGRHYSAKSGAAYTIGKQGVIALCHSINMEENARGIRSTAICPSDINTGFLEFRPQRPDEEARRTMLQVDDLADAADFVLNLRPGVCVNEMVITGVAGR